MTPLPPLIAIEGEALYLVAKGDELYAVSMLNLINGQASGAHYFDGFGKIWKSQIGFEASRHTFLQRLLARTFYNPVLQIDRTWTQIESYSLQQLKDQIKHCIDHDDDILTQFVEADNLKARLQGCRDFSSILDMLTKYIFEPDEENIDKEFSLEN